MNKIIFIGTGYFAYNILKLLNKINTIDIITFTKINKNIGRNQLSKINPINELSKTLNIKTFNIKNINNFNTENKINFYTPDLIIISEYDKILNQNILTLRNWAFI